MKTIVEYLINNHINGNSNIKQNVDDIFANPIDYNGLSITTEKDDTVKNFNKSNTSFKSASDFIKEFIKLWDELPKEKNKYSKASLYYNGPDLFGFDLYTENDYDYKVVFWLNKKNTWGVSGGNYTYCYNTHKEIFENILLDL